MQTLEEAREEKRIPKTAVAEHLGITRQTYALYEKEPERFTIGQARAACDFIGCDFNEIFFGSNVISNNARN